MPAVDGLELCREVPLADLAGVEVDADPARPACGTGENPSVARLTEAGADGDQRVDTGLQVRLRGRVAAEAEDAERVWIAVGDHARAVSLARHLADE